MKLNMFRATPPIIRSLKLHWQPLVFHTWKVVSTCSWWTTCFGRHTAHHQESKTALAATDFSYVVGCLDVQSVENVHQLHVQTTFHVWKTRGCQCSFRLLMMGGVLLKTYWASYKYGIIKFWYLVASCWIFFMNQCDRVLYLTWSSQDAQSAQGKLRDTWCTSSLVLVCQP
jgi:hypothetical protein